MCFSLSSCSNLSYYTQAAIGQLEVLSARRDINEVLIDDEVPEPVKARLRLAQEILVFAEQEIGLPVEDTFSAYADIGRTMVVYNVFAAKPYSSTLESFCFPIAGCVVYKGFFDRADAITFADELKSDGFETYTGGVAAYSTLGWFSDPLLNTFILRSEEDLAALIFHELAHKIVYVKDDSQFNESFATTVERYALEMWLKSKGKEVSYKKFIAGKDRQSKVIDLILSAKADLATIYSGNNVKEMSAQKTKTINLLRENYASLAASWDSGAEFKHWMSSDINNAKLGAVGTYQAWVASLNLLLQESDSFAAFVEQVEMLANLDVQTREAKLIKIDLGLKQK